MSAVDAEIQVAEERYERTRSDADFRQLFALKLQRGGLCRRHNEAPVELTFPTTSGSPSQPSQPPGGRTPQRAESWPWKITFDVYQLERLRQLEWNGREQGGFLIGPTAHADYERRVDRVLPCSRDDDATGTSVRLDWERLGWHWQELPLDQTVVGCYHNHPPNNSTNLSPTDLKAAGSMAASVGRSEWLSVIVSSQHDYRDRWEGSQVTAHLIRLDGSRPYSRTLDISEWRI